jgi:hypothetical protein
VNTECCSGNCVGGMCISPPTDQCHVLGQGCGGNEDCCPGVECYANVCSNPPG